jgi:hypothetical protein
MANLLAGPECYTYNTAVRRLDPFFPVGVWYAGAVVRRHLQSIKAAGFNSVWSRPEGHAELVAQANAAGLHASVQVDRAGDLQVDPSATAADLRVWGWTALLRGARAVSYHAWPDLVDNRGVLTPRGRSAGEFAGVISRNPALFAPLRPRTAATREAIPDVRIAEDAGEAEAGFLESRDALVLVAINHASAPQRLSMSFAPGTKQEFWQNMETGEMVSFTMVKETPALTHDFGPRDALVLMIRKTSPHDRGPGRPGARKPGSRGTSPQPTS